MKEVKLKSMELINFKGIKNMSIDFADGTTEIRGDNATGKTTIQDAFTWCLFGKDSQDRTDSGRGAFALKTVDEKGNIIERIDHAVTVALEVDRRRETFTRRIKENWVKPRGEEEVILKGNDTIYLIDGVEVKAKDYNEKINSIISEQLFKLITNPAYFPGLHWETQRETLISIAGGDLTIEGIAKGRENFEKIINKLEGKSLAKFKEAIAYRLKKVKEEMAETDPTLKGIDRGTPEAPDYQALEAQRVELQKEMQAMELSLTNINESARQYYKQQEEKQKQISELKSKKDSIFYETRSTLTKAIQEKKQKRESSFNDINNDIQKATSALRAKDDSLYSIDNEIRRTKDRMYDLEEQIERKRKAWIDRNAETYQETEEGTLTCPLYKIVCQDTKANKLYKEKKDTARQTFIELQNKDLDRINNEGADLAAEKEKAEERLKTWENKRASEKADQEEAEQNLKKLKETLQEMKQNSPEIDNTVDPYSDQSLIKAFAEIDKEIEAIRGTLKDQPENHDDEEKKKVIAQRRQEITAQTEEIVKELAKKDLIEKNNKEREQVLARDAKLSQQKTELERQVFTADELHSTYITEVERRVNEKFKLVQFKMFEKQLNGAEVPTCVAMLGGVNYSDLNSAAKINAGLDIINTLQQYNKVKAPIFIDNAESINEIYPIAAQKILLRVTKDPELKVITNQEKYGLQEVEERLEQFTNSFK